MSTPEDDPHLGCKTAFARLWADNQALTDRLDAVSGDDLKLVKVCLEARRASYEFKSRTAQVIAASLAGLLDDARAENCLELDYLAPEPYGRILLTLQIARRKSPLQLRTEALAERDKALAELVVVKDRLAELAREALLSAMHEASQELWGSSWLTGLEHELWHMVERRETASRDASPHERLSRADLERLHGLAREADGWWVWKRYAADAGRYVASRRLGQGGAPP